MASLRSGLLALGITGPEATYIRSKVKGYRDEGEDPHEAALDAVSDLLADAQRQYLDVANQIHEALLPEQRLTVFPYKDHTEEFAKGSVRPHVRTHPTTGAMIPVAGYTNSKPSHEIAHHTPARDEREWIGVDFDKTLAYHEPGSGISEGLGHPIPSMMRRVRDWLKAGKRVKIMTARAMNSEQIPKIQAWLVEHGLPKLEVTNVKDHLMGALYDDKAVGIHPNTGARTDRMQKAHINTYTKQDGTVVQAHEDSRAKRENASTNKTPAHGIETAAFKQWFGDSKVVDDHGKPLVVYHGTGDSFKEFEFDHPHRKDDGWLGRGFYFSSHHQIAGGYTSLKPGDAPNIIPAFLSLQNPYEANVTEKRTLQSASKAEIDDWTEELKTKGHDGVILHYAHNENGRSPSEYVAFSPTQIKSATGNVGTFDPTNPDITKSQPSFASTKPSTVPFPTNVLTVKRKGKGGGHAIDYKTTFQGLPITIENRKGSLRQWGNPDDGTAGTTKMEFPYGYIRGTEGLDGDGVDCFLGPNPDAKHAFVIHQLQAPDFIVHDEDKCMLGWETPEDAAAAYLRHYTDARFLGSMSCLPMGEFTEKVQRTREHPGFIKSAMATLQRFLKADAERWITVHPHGPGTAGQPIKIRESAGSPGTYHVVGGAGGKLNYLKLTDVKSPEEYKAKAKERGKESRAKAKAQVTRDKELGLVDSKKQVMSTLKADREKHQRALIEQVANLKGWQDYDLKPEQLDGLSDRAKEAAILKHHRHLHRDAQQVIQATKETLLLDAEARAEAELGELSIHRDEPNVLGLTDLSPDPQERGLGYQPDYGPHTEDIAEEAQAFKDEQAAKRDPARQERMERMQDAANETREEVAKAEASGQLVAPVRETSGVDPRHAVALLAAHKQTQATLKQIQEKKKEVQGSTRDVQAKSYVIQAEPVSSEEILKDLMADAAERTRHDRATSFLTMVEHDPFDEQPEDHQASLRRHIQIGSASMLSRVSQQVTGVDILPREVVDVLGTAGAAQALANAIHTNFSEDQVKAWAEQLGQYHADHQGTVTEEAVGRAKEAYEQAQEMVMESVTSPSELAIANELNEKRLGLLREARESLGATLGELEAMGALNLALRSQPTEEMMVSMGGVSTETAIRQLKALGLDKDDYDIDSDGTNHFALIAGGGLGKVVRPIDQEDLAHRQVVNAILGGQHDEDGWVPAGFAHRPDTSFTDPERQAVTYAQPYQTSPQGTHDEDIQQYIGQRMADGHAPHDIYKDLFSDTVLGHIPSDDHDAYFQALDRVAPLYDEAGKPRTAESHQAAWEEFAEQALTQKYGQDATPLHKQSLRTQDPHTFEAIHRVMAEDPTRGVAFTPTGELTHQDQSTLRHLFEARFAKPEAHEATTEAMAALGPEPAKESAGLFGTQDNPEWHEHQSKKQRILEEAQANGLTWEKYVKMHGSRMKAFQALQDIVKGEAAHAFAKEYGRVHRQPLQLGRTTVTNHLAHVDAVNPHAREARLAEERQVMDRLRNRAAGRYAGGGAKDKLDRVRELSAIADQNQRTMFAADPEGVTKVRPLKEAERHTLGHTAEAQLAAMWPQVARNFSPDRPVSLMVNKRMDGTYINQQRAVKLIAHNKRMALALGTGSGKTAVMLGAFTHLHAQGQVKRGFFAVPSVVQGEFGVEAAANIEPGTYSWWGKPDAPRDERLAAYKNPDHQMIYVTHQALRDDLVHLMAKKEGLSESEMAEQFKAMKEEDRTTLMQATLKAEGIHPDFFAIDEGHDTLNRAGKEDSLLSNVLDAFHMPLPYYVSSSADPMKNDLSELYSQLHKIDPKKFNNMNAFMGKYGLKTNASQDVLKRELRRYLLPGKVDPGIQATHHDDAISLSDHQRDAYDGVMKDYRTARAARQHDTVDLGAAKRLSPTSFEGRDDAEHHEIATGIHRNLGIVRDGALERVLNDTKPAHNAKAHKVLELADRYKQEDKPGVIFARSRKAVDHLQRMLSEEGHRVLTITGSDTAKEKAKKIGQFRPPPGREPEADIVVASDAAAVGANLQRGQYLIHYDLPHTSKTWHQRTGRIHRLGQQHDIHVHTLATDTRLDAKKKDRLDRKTALREHLTSPYESLSDEHELYTLLRHEDEA